MTDQRWNVIVILSAAITLAVVFGFALGATFSTGCSDIKEAPVGCFEWWFARYQTLLAMVGAFAIAILAARPVWKQLMVASLQTSITMQQALSARERLMSTRALKDMEALERLSREIRYGYNQREDEPGVLTHWVWDMSSNVGAELERLTQSQSENLDGDEAAIARQNLILTFNRLADCMSDYNATVHLDYMETEMAVTEEMRAQAEQAERAAADELPHKIDKMWTAIAAFQTALQKDLGEVRLKRQFMDQVLLKANNRIHPV